MSCACSVRVPVLAKNPRRSRNSCPGILQTCRESGIAALAMEGIAVCVVSIGLGRSFVSSSFPTAMLNQRPKNRESRGSMRLLRCVIVGKLSAHRKVEANFPHLCLCLIFPTSSPPHLAGARLLCRMIHHSGHLPPKRSETARIPFRASGPLCFRGSAATAKAQFRLIRGLPRDRVHETGVPQTMCVGGKSASENRTASQPSCASPKLYPHRKSGDSLARQLSRSSDGCQYARLRPSPVEYR